MCHNCIHTLVKVQGDSARLKGRTQILKCFSPKSKPQVLYVLWKDRCMDACVIYGNKPVLGSESTCFNVSILNVNILTERFSLHKPRIGYNMFCGFFAHKSNYFLFHYQSLSRTAAPTAAKCNIKCFLLICKRLRWQVLNLFDISVNNINLLGGR